MSGFRLVRSRVVRKTESSEISKGQLPLGTARRDLLRERDGLSEGDLGQALLVFGDARSELQNSKREEMGTGARGAPVPEVGLYVKIKGVQSRMPGSRPNEGRVNSPR